MTILSKKSRDECLKELDDRYDQIRDLLSNARDLKSKGEGLKRKYWAHPEVVCFIDAFKLRLAISDFANILNELKKRSW